QAQLKAYQSSLEVYRLNLDFTRVTSPIDGRVSRYYLTLGNLVNQDQTLLTTVVSQDPMYVYFDTDEPTLLRIRRAVSEGRMKPADRVVVGGLQQVRPRMEVRPDQTPMPTLGPSPEGKAAQPSQGEQPGNKQ